MGSMTPVTSIVNIVFNDREKFSSKFGFAYSLAFSITLEPLIICVRFALSRVRVNTNHTAITKRLDFIKYHKVFIRVL